MSFTLADSNLGRVAFNPTAESIFGTPPAGNMQILRVTSAEFNAIKETIVSDELRSDRMVSTLTEAAAMAQGNINFELSLGGSFDTLIQAALCGTIGTATNVTNVAAASPANTFSATGIGTNVVVGQWVYASGFTNAANNGWHRVTNVTTGAITVATTLVTETAAAGNTVRGRLLRNGTVKRSFAFEQAFTDINQFFRFAGMRVGTFSLDLTAGQIATGSFGLQGSTVTVAASTFAGTPVAATSTSVVNATSNAGAVLESSTYTALTTALQSVSFNVDNALRNQMAIGNKFPVGIGYGRQTVSGSITAYFRDATLFNKFLNHDATALSFAVEDAANPRNAMRITFPRVFFSTDNPNIPGIDQDVMETIEFTAVQDPTTNCQIQIDLIGT